MIEISARCDRCGHSEDQQTVVSLNDLLKFVCTFCENEFCLQCEETPHMCDECATNSLCDGCMSSTTLCTKCREGLDEEIYDRN